MGDGATQASSRVLFSVRALDGRFYFENICGMIQETLPLMDIHDVFPGSTGEEIIRRCRLAVSGEVHNEGFIANLGHGRPYKLTLIHYENNTSFFTATPLDSSQIAASHSVMVPQNMYHLSYFHELADHSQNGIFIWQITSSGRYLLIYTNDAYLSLTGITKASLGKTLEESYLPDKADFIRTHFDSCVKTRQTVSYTHKHHDKIISVNLYPSFEDERVARIMGTATNITDHVLEKQQLEQANEQLSRCEVMLRDQLKFEELIASTTRRFMDTGGAGFGSCVKEFIAQLGTLLDVSFACVWKNDEAVYGASYKWVSDEQNNALNAFNIHLEPDFPAWINHFYTGRLVVINDMLNHKKSPFPRLISFGAKNNVRAMLIVPVMRGNDLWGVIGLGQLYDVKVWSTMEVSMLKIAAETIMSAYLRVRTERQLNESNRILVEYDECLQDMLAVQETLAAVSQRYTTAGLSDFDACTDDMLADLSELLDLDNVSLYVFSDTNISATYEWSKKGMMQWHSLDNIIHKNIPSWKNMLTDKDVITINSTLENTQPIPQSMLETLLLMGVKSLLILPIRQGDTLRGAMVFSKILGYHKWSNANIKTVKMFGEVFLGAYLRKLEEQQLIMATKTHSEFVRHTIKQADVLLRLTRYSQAFIDATSDSLLPTVICILKEIAPALQIESLNLSRYFEGHTEACRLFSWNAPGRIFGHADKNDTPCCIPLLYKKSVWGCLHVRYTDEKATGERSELLELFGQYFVRAYMRIYPTQNLVPAASTDDHASMNLVPQPAAI